MHVIEENSPRAPIWIVGEAPGEAELARQRPFVGPSGYELDRMLAEAGISRSDCFLTNVCHERPPSYVKNGKPIHNDINQFFAAKLEAKRLGLPLHRGRFPREPITQGLVHLNELYRGRHPRLTIALGNTPLWALAGEMGVTKWRGSVINTDEFGKILTTFHPADVLQQWPHRPIVVQDFRRAAREAETDTYTSPATHYGWEFVTEPSLSDIIDWFHAYASDSERPLVCDTEGWGRVDCIGFAADTRHAICIPFTRPTATDPAECHYWPSPDDEFTATQACRTALCSRPIVFHNAIWDCQVIARRWGMIPRLHADTQLMQHVAYPGLLGGRIDSITGRVDKKGSSLSLSFIASMYCANYRYWKDDGRQFDPAIHDESQYWRYNCEDCVRTYECLEVLDSTLDRLGLRDQFEFEMRLFGPVLKMMFRGIQFDAPARDRARAELDRTATSTRDWLNTVVGCDFNPDSTPQMQTLFYSDLALPRQLNRKTKSPTLDDAALETLARRNPLIRPLVSQIQNYRTCVTLRSHLDARPCADTRFRTALNIAFVETMRFSSNETAFGEGTNMQNWKRPDE